MEYSAQEMKLIERLRKQNRQWVWVRWIVFSLGILSTVALVVTGWLLH